MSGGPSEIELWGGVECTVNRSGDRYRDQLRLSGHHHRLSDLDLFAELGLKAIRYPVLWERTVPGRGVPDWSWPDERLGRLRELGIRPIAGLVHHGSGPPHTHLLDDGFAPGLGQYAREVAARYPWLEDWTPINEPLTTARFSALYGHWYPHARDQRAFWLALLNQVDATRAAMRAIRRINPAARLIQTDDLGRTYATPPLADQADHDNMRRWAGWDLLFGRVDRSHPLFDHMDRLGLGDRLLRIADDPCPPDIIGINHYLTSDRFLDHRLARYPSHLHGGNDRSAYADTEAIRVMDPPPAGLGGALREAWQRYSTQIAVTEVHNGCTREEQLRWAAEAWDTCTAVAAEGADVRAVTAWSLLGSQGWNTLLTGDGRYEPGVYDVAAGVPRPTALVSLWQGLPRGAPRHPVAMEEGWWRRPQRLIYGASISPAPEDAPSASSPLPSRPLLIWDGEGTATQALVRACIVRGIRHAVVKRNPSVLAAAGNVASILDPMHPWGVLYIRTDDALRGGDPLLAVKLARACATREIAFLDLVDVLEYDVASPASDSNGHSGVIGSIATVAPAVAIHERISGEAVEKALDRLIDDASDMRPLRNSG